MCFCFPLSLTGSWGRGLQEGLGHFQLSPEHGISSPEGRLVPEVLVPEDRPSCCLLLSSFQCPNVQLLQENPDGSFLLCQDFRLFRRFPLLKARKKEAENTLRL